jgi:hypothetical protein
MMKTYSSAMLGGCRRKNKRKIAKPGLMKQLEADKDLRIKEPGRASNEVVNYQKETAP